MLKFNSFRSQRYLRSRFVEGTFLLASEASDIQLELIDLSRQIVKQQVGDIALGTAWKVEKVVTACNNKLQIRPGEAWFCGLPFNMRSTSDVLITLGCVPGCTTIANDTTDGGGKIITLPVATVGTNTYKVVIEAAEAVITNVEDKFIKNNNLSEATAQKMRLIYKINIVPAASVDNTLVPYKAECATDQNLTNDLVVSITCATSEGSFVSLATTPGNEELDGGDIEITFKNTTAGPLPRSVSDQAAFQNGKLVDNLSNEYTIVSLRQDACCACGNQTIIRIDTEPCQANPTVNTTCDTYTLIKKDVYATNATSGLPNGQLFWPIADVSWVICNGILHSSSITDLRVSTLAREENDIKVHDKFDLVLTGGGIILKNPDQKATQIYTITNVNNLTADTDDTVTVNGTVLTAVNCACPSSVQFAAVACSTVCVTATSLAAQINANACLCEVTATAKLGVVTVEAVARGTTGNIITTVYTDNGCPCASVGATVGGATLTGGGCEITGGVDWACTLTLVRPESTFVGTATTNNILLVDEGSLVFKSNLDATANYTLNSGIKEVNIVSVACVSCFDVLTLTSTCCLACVKVGNTIHLVGTEGCCIQFAHITAVDDVCAKLTLSGKAVITGTGFARIYLDTYARGTLPTCIENYVVATRQDCIIHLHFTVNMQEAYDRSLNPELVVDSTRGAFTIQDNSTPIAAPLLEVQSFGGCCTFFMADVGGIEVCGNIGVNTCAPQGCIHIESSSAGAICPCVAADELIIESSGDTGLTIYSGTTNCGSILFGDSGDDNIGKIVYDHNVNDLVFTTNTAVAMTIDCGGCVGIGVSCPLGTLHIESATAGCIVPCVAADELVIENSGDAGLTIYSGTTNCGSILFGDSGDDNIGGIIYDHCNNSLRFVTNNCTRMTMSSAGVVCIACDIVATLTAAQTISGKQYVHFVTCYCSAQTLAYGTDYFVIVTGNTTICLPTAVGNNGKMFIIKKTDTTGTTVTVDGNACETIDGTTTVTITQQFASLTIISASCNWHIM